MSVTTRYIGIVDGLHTWEVLDSESGEVVGLNQSADQPE